MNPIQLTPEHKTKLLEMCSKLFPEYNLKIYKKDFEKLPGDFRYSKYKPQKPTWIIGYNGVVYLQLFYEYFEDMSYEIIEIHWFEFCLTHLIVKLANEFTNQKLSKSDYTNNQYPNWFSEKLVYHLNPFRNEEFEEDVEFIHPIDYLYEEFKKLKL